MADERARGDNEPIRVLIADDHALFRRGLNMVLESEEGIEVVAEAEDGQDAIAKAEEFAPDVVLMDVRMPRVSGIEATRTIRDVIPTAKILMLTVSDEEEDLYEAIKAGANGYLLKEISIEEVADAIRAGVQGQSLISPSMASEVLKLVAQGMSNREIAEDLYISENTVKNHVRNILEKLHLHSRMEAVVYAVREKLLDLDEAVGGEQRRRDPA